MILFGIQFLALLLTGVLLGGMLFFSFAFAPLLFIRLPAEVAGPFIRGFFPVYYGIGAAMALVTTALVATEPSSIPLGSVGVAFLVLLLWLMPKINRLRDQGTAGDAAAMARFNRLHRASVIVNAGQMVALVVAFALLTVGA